MYDDLGRPITEAGPSTPVQHHRPRRGARTPTIRSTWSRNSSTAREIAENARSRNREAQPQQASPRSSLETLTAAKTKTKITELKVILKAEARGSVEAIRKELEKLVHDEVRCRVLHAGIGAITECDVILALTSPDDTIVIGFNVTADDAALRLAEERGDSAPRVRHHLQADRRREGGPRRQAQADRGSRPPRPGRRPRDVQDQQGRHHRRLLRHQRRHRASAPASASSARAWSSYPPAEKVVGLDSLKRFKDDVKEVREGFECGMKITGFDDVKVDDVIEAFKIEIKQRTL